MARKRSRYDELEVLGRELTEDEIHEQLRMLARDDRFAAVIEWLVRSERGWKVEVANAASTEAPANLAAHAGGMGACMRLEAQLRGIVDRMRNASPPSPAD